MDKITRIYKLHEILKITRYPLTSKQIAESLQCSSRSINRHINEYIDEFGAPIEKTKDHKYQYTDKTFELPGIWLNATELIALATMQSILKDVETGIFKQ
ncbi:MAG: HTH domain-containing protein, partial [Gammaproteobacteria bacterium]